MKGLNHVVSSNGNSTAQKRKYNGKEYEQALGLNLYEMEVRSLDPALGRWLSIDPVTHHSQSTYNGFDNNPVYYADPSGADSDNRTRHERNADPAQGAKIMGMGIYETTTTMTLTNYKKINYSDGTSSTVEGTSESFEVSSVTHYGDGEVISSQSADVDVRITNQEVGRAKVRSYPQYDGSTYQVPLYKVILSGEDLKGKKILQDFKALRFGVQLNAEKGINSPRIVGLSNEQTHIARWDKNAMKGYGAWRVTGNFLIHFGVQYPNKRAQGNTGCVSICGTIVNGGKSFSGWNYFQALIKHISGKSIEKTKLRVNYQEVFNKPKLKKIKK